MAHFGGDYGVSAHDRESWRAASVRYAAPVMLCGFEVQELAWDVPLLHPRVAVGLGAAEDDPRHQRRLELRGRFVRNLGDRDVHRRLLVYLQGGPGFGSPAAPDHQPWIHTAISRGFAVLLLDQRGTGRSSPVVTETVLAEGSADRQARFLECFRADSIVEDFEHLRLLLDVPAEQWNLLGQSFGGFVLLHYLSTYPDSVGFGLFTGGLPGLDTHADDVYERTFATVLERNREFYARFPEDVVRIGAIVRALRRKPAVLRGGGLLTARRFRQQGIKFGYFGGMEMLHRAIERLWAAFETRWAEARRTRDVAEDARKGGLEGGAGGVAGGGGAGALGSVSSAVHRPGLPPVSPIVTSRPSPARSPEDSSLLPLSLPAHTASSSSSSTSSSSSSPSSSSSSPSSDDGAEESAEAFLRAHMDDARALDLLAATLQAWEPLHNLVLEDPSHDTHIFYGILHEAIYAQGGRPTAWSASRIEQRFPLLAEAAAADADERTAYPSPVPLTGEMVFPWMFDDYAGLRPLKEVAELLAGKEDWPPLYHRDWLRFNGVPCVAAVYERDLYVPLDLSLATAAAIPNLHVIVDPVREHTAVRDSADISEQLFDALDSLAGRAP